MVYGVSLLLLLLIFVYLFRYGLLKVIYCSEQWIVFFVSSAKWQLVNERVRIIIISHVKEHVTDILFEIKINFVLKFN